VRVYPYPFHHQPRLIESVYTSHVHRAIECVFISQVDWRPSSSTPMIVINFIVGVVLAILANITNAVLLFLIGRMCVMLCYHLDSRLSFTLTDKVPLALQGKLTWILTVITVVRRSHVSPCFRWRKRILRTIADRKGVNLFYRADSLNWQLTAGDTEQQYYDPKAQSFWLRRMVSFQL